MNIRRRLNIINNYMSEDKEEYDYFRDTLKLNIIDFTKLPDFKKKIILNTIIPACMDECKWNLKFYFGLWENNFIGFNKVFKHVNKVYDCIKALYDIIHHYKFQELLFEPEEYHTAHASFGSEAVKLASFTLNLVDDENFGKVGDAEK